MARQLSPPPINVSSDIDIAAAAVESALRPQQRAKAAQDIVDTLLDLGAGL
jgi:hypothetical protein